MQYNVKFEPGNTVYRKFKGKTLAHIVTQVNIVSTIEYTHVNYHITRNTETGYPSGGNLSYVEEELLTRNPE